MHISQNYVQIQWSTQQYLYIFNIWEKLQEFFEHLIFSIMVLVASTLSELQWSGHFQYFPTRFSSPQKLFLVIPNNSNSEFLFLDRAGAGSTTWMNQDTFCFLVTKTAWIKHPQHFSSAMMRSWLHTLHINSIFYLTEKNSLTK